MKYAFLFLFFLALMACDQSDTDSNEKINPLYLPKKIDFFQNNSNSLTQKTSNISIRSYVDDNTDYSESSTEYIKYTSTISNFLNFPNSFLCILDQLKVYDQVNKGTYEVLGEEIDEQACSPDVENTEIYHELIVSSTRADNSSPHEILVYISFSVPNETGTVDYRAVLDISIKKGISETTPYGIFNYQNILEYIDNGVTKSQKFSLSLGQKNTKVSLSIVVKSAEFQFQGIVTASTLKMGDVQSKVVFNDVLNETESSKSQLEVRDNNFFLRVDDFKNANLMDAMICQKYNPIKQSVSRYYLFDVESGEYSKSIINLDLNYTHSVDNDLNNTGLYDGEEFVLRLLQWDDEKPGGSLLGLPVDSESLQYALHLKAGTLVGNSNEYVLKPKIVRELSVISSLEDCSDLNIEDANDLELPSTDILSENFTLTLSDAPVLPISPD